MTSAASAGGAAGAGGVGLQNRAFAWAAAALIAESPLPAVSIPGMVVRVGAQTGFEMDDVAVETDTGAFALFQVKAGLGLGVAEDSPLADALEQAVGQFTSGRLPVNDGTDRVVDPTRDALVLCTDRTAPATVRNDLRVALARTGSQPPGTRLGHELTVGQGKALDVVLAHARRLWQHATGKPATDEDLRGLIRALHLVTVDAHDGEPDHASSLATLALALPSEQAGAAWPVLVDQGQAAATNREWRDRASIAVALSRHSIYITPAKRHSDDVAKLLALSAANLTEFAGHASLPVSGGLHIPRAPAKILAEKAEDLNVLIVGDAGAGKSAITQGFAASRTADQPVVIVRAGDVAGTNRLGLDNTLDNVLRDWPGPPALLVIDGVDALRGGEDRNFLSTVVRGIAGSRWQVVASVRSFDARNNYALQEAFPGSSLSSDPTASDPRLAGVRHLVIGDLTDTEIDAAVTRPVPLASILQAASPELRTLLRNPFNLRLAAVLSDTLGSGDRDELLGIRTRVQLLEAYWDRRVRAENVTAREGLLTRLCRQMTDARALQVVEAEPVVSSADSDAVQSMLSENVLAVEAGAMPVGRRVLAFAHNILFDYATALYLLVDPLDHSHLLRELDADPALPLVARPSLDLLADMLWEHRASGAFWPLCLEISASQHVLASLAFAGRVLRLATGRDDLLELAPVAGSSDAAAGLSTSQEIIRRLVGGFRAPAVVTDPRVAAVPLSALARRLAENATSSRMDAMLAADLLQALHIRIPLSADAPCVADRCFAIVALLDACRTDPAEMEGPAGAVVRQVPQVVEGSEVVRAAVSRLIDDAPALAAWGGTALPWLADAVPSLVRVDAALARSVARTVLTFEETRDAQVTFGGGPLLQLNMSRRQHAEHGAWQLGERFAAVCAADLPTAAAIFCDLAEHDAEEFDDGDWPLSAGGATGYLRYGRHMSMTAHAAGEKAASALSAALSASEDEAHLHAALKVLVESLHNASGWAALLESTSDPAALGQALTPVLESGTLLAHPETHSSAAELLTALANAARDHKPASSRLEQMVLQAHALIDANAGHPSRKDALIGCLRPEGITTPELAERVDELGPDGPPPVRPRMSVEASFTPWSLVGGLLEQGVSIATDVEEVARNLDHEVRAARNGRDDRAEGERRLLEVFEAAHIVFAACPDLHPRLALLLVEAAEVLAADPRVGPDTPVGDRVATLLLEAAGSDGAGEMSE